MRLLLDECVHQGLAKEIVGHDVKTVPAMGWANFKDKELLLLAKDELDVFITVDRNLPQQQNLSKLTLIVIVLRAKTNRLQDLKPLVPKLVEMLPSMQAGQAHFIEHAEPE